MNFRTNAPSEFTLATRCLIASIFALLVHTQSFANEQWYVDNVPSGHWVEISTNSPADIDPCPSNNCSYSRNEQGKSVITAWTGAVFADGLGSLGSYIVGPGGGHESYDGDEFYVFDMNNRSWSRPYNPTDPVGPYDSNNGESRLDRPVASHTYGLQGWDPNYGGPNGALIMFVGGKDGDAGGTPLKTHAYPFDRNDGTWDRLDHLGAPGTGGTATWDPNRQHFVIQNAFLPVSASTYNVMAPAGQKINTLNNRLQEIDHSAAIDPTRDILLTIDYRHPSNPGVFYTDLNTKVRTKASTSSFPSGLTSSNIQKMGVEYVPALDGFVGYIGRGNTSTYLLKPPAGNLASGTWQWTRLDATGGVTPSAMRSGVEGRIYTRWQWVESLRLFVIIQRYGGPVYAYRPPGVQPPDGSNPSPIVNLSASPSTVNIGGATTLSWAVSNASSCTATGAWGGTKNSSGGSEVISSLASTSSFGLACTGVGGTTNVSTVVSVITPDPDPDPDPDPGASNWSARSTAPGVLMATRFDTEDEVTNWVHPDSREGNVSWDQSNRSSGNGSLRFDILKTDGASSGSWRRWLSDDEREFKEGDELYVSYRQYVPLYLRNIRFLDGGGWKQSIISRRSFRMNGVNQPQPYGSNQLNEVVLNNNRYRGYPQGYNRTSTGEYKGWDVSAQTACSSTDFRHQNAVDRGAQNVGTACENDRARYGGLYSAGYTQGAPDPLTGAVIYEPDTWQTYKVYLKIGSQGTNTENSAVKVWVANEGQDFDLIVDRNNLDLGLGPTEPYHDTLWLLPYDTGRSADPTRLDTYTLYDEVIVSLNDIAAPDSESGAPPTVQINASSAIILPGGSVQLTWNSTNADVCTASDDWSGNKALNGSESVGPLSGQARFDFTLTCTNSFGSRFASTSVDIEQALSYTISQSSSAAHDDSFALNGAVVSNELFAYVTPDQGINEVRFFLDNTSATGTQDHTEFVAPFDFDLSGTSGFDTTSLANGIHTLTARLFLQSGAEEVVTVTFTVSNQIIVPPPTVVFTAEPVNVPFNGFTTLMWQSTLAESCVASGDWTGTKSITGSEAIGPLTANQTFFLSCTGAGGTASQTAIVLVAAPAAPVVNISASPNSIPFDGSTTVSWSATNATTCVASDGWTGTRGVVGSEIVGAIQANTAFTLSCAGPGGEDTASTVVTVGPRPAPIIDFSASPTTVDFNGATTLTWATTHATSCTASGSWFGPRATVGTSTIGPLTNSGQYTLTCSGEGGTNSETISVTVGDAPAPTLNFNVNPLNVDFNGAAIATWQTTNVTSCTASGDWSGSRGPAGIQSFGQLQSNITLTLTCVGEGGSVSDTKTVVVAAAAAPSITLAASPLTVDYSSVSQITWSVDNADSCVASGDWSGSRAVSGSVAVGPLLADSTYILSCTGEGGTSQDSVSVTVNPAVPTVTLSATPLSIPFEGSSTLNWVSEHATDCVATGGWSGSVGTSGSQSTGTLSADSAFSITCTGAGGSASDSVTVNVAQAGAPSVSFFATPTSVSAGDTTSLTWSSANTTACTASGDWSGALATSGTQTVGPLAVDSTFIVTCSGVGGDAAQTITVAIVEPQPSVTLSAAPLSVDYDGSTTLTWNVDNADSCEAIGNWSGSRPTSGSETINNLTVGSTFVLFCEGAGGSGTNVVSVNVALANAPVVQLSASTDSVIYGGSVDLTWTAQNATSCESYGGWNGTQATSGTFSTGPINANTDYVLVCSGPGGQSDATTSVSVQIATPTVSIAATPTQVSFGESTTLSWSSTGSDRCEAYGSWSGAKAASGVEQIPNLLKDSSFVLLCIGPGGDASSVASVTVSEAPVPTITFVADPTTVSYGESAVLSWTTEYTDSCEAFGGWSGDQPTNGVYTATNLESTTNFTLLCSGLGGNRAESRTVIVLDAPRPIIEFFVEPGFIFYGGAAILTWSVENAQSCIATGDWDGIKPTSGTESILPLFDTANFTLICTGDGGSSSHSISASVATLAEMSLQNFEGDGLFTDPAGWVDTGPSYSTTVLPSAFKVRDVAGTQALAVTRNTGSNIHSHYVLNNSDTWQDYRYSGRVRVSNVEDKVGVTVLSSMPDTATYYRLGISETGSNFVLSSHGLGIDCVGDLDTGVEPDPGNWYRYSIEAQSSGAATELQARVWQDGDDEPSEWQAQCTDNGASRLFKGRVGVWVSLQTPSTAGAWDEMMVTPISAPPVQPPVLRFYATPVNVTELGFTTLSWDATNADSCTASGDWSGPRSVAGMEQTAGLAQNSTFTLECSGAGGSTTSSVVVTVGAAGSPVLQFTATPESPFIGDDVVLEWTASDAAICIALGDWSGSRATSGSEIIQGVQQDLTFTLNCIGAGGVISETLNVNLADAIRDPEMDFSLIPYGLGVDGTAVVVWRTENTDTCTATGDWSGDLSVSGFRLVGPVQVRETYVLTCEGRGGSVSDMIEISYVDGDGDGMPDVWETAIFGSLQNNGLGDSDGDGLIDRDEYLHGTNPREVDTDGDGQNDADEVQFGSNPRDAGDNYGDSSPVQPQLADDSKASLSTYTIEPTNSYQDPDGNPLSYSRWHIALDTEFENVIFDRDVDDSIMLVVPFGVFDPGVTYYVRTRHFDSSGTPSVWSETAILVTDTQYPNDSDGDGIDDAYQVPGTPDTNANGVADINEGICNLYSAEGRNVIGLTTNTGVIRCYTSIPNSEIDETGVVTDMELPLGMFSFRVEGLISNEQSPAEVFVSIWLPEDYDPTSGWQKFDEATGELMDYSEFVTYNGNRVTLRLVDGGIGDQDGVVNGVIVDPSGPLIASADAPVTPEPPAPEPPTGGGGSDGGGGGAVNLLALALLSGLALRRRRYI